MITKIEDGQFQATTRQHGDFVASLCEGRTLSRARNISSYIVDVTPKMAEKLLEMNFERNRGVRKTNLARFTQRLASDEFFEGSAIRLVHSNGRFTLTDGQHRLEAIVLADCAATMTVVIVDGDPAEDYALLDSEGIKRGTADVMDALDRSNEFGALTQASKFAYNSALRIIFNNFLTRFQMSRMNNEQMMAIAREYNAERKTFTEWAGLSHTGASRGIWRAPILAVALVTIKHADPKLTESFWRQVVADDGLRSKDPRKMLHGFIRERRMTGGATGQSQNAVVAATCWNYFVEGKELGKLYASKSMPKIALTPYPLVPKTEEAE